MSRSTPTSRESTGKETWPRSARGSTAATFPAPARAKRSMPLGLEAAPSPVRLQEFVRCAAMEFESEGYFAVRALTVNPRWRSRSGNWRNEASGSGQSFTGVKSDSGSSWRKTAMECWVASGLGGSSVANCERSAGRSGDARKCWGAFGRSWSIDNAGSGFRWGKAHSEAVREIESKAGGVYREGLEGSEKRAG